ncbi:transposase, partial [Mesorhizobium sp. M0162]|uniref:transposase n=1 Tax=unclassified Mesorhizobium TaxID=325217 RepID=UPI00333C7AD1
MEIGTSEAEPIWTEFLRKLTRRGLRGVKLVVSDAHEGLKAAVTKVLCATWQRCRVQLHEERAGPCRQERPQGRLSLHRHRFRPGNARGRVRTMARRRRPDPAEGAEAGDNHGRRRADVLAYMTFPKEHRAKLHSTNPIERLNGEIKRRTEVVEIFPNDDAVVRLVGAILLEQNDEWAVQRARYMTLETISQMSDDPLISLP